MLQQRADAHRRGDGIGLRRLHGEPLERAANAHDGGHAALRRAHRERSVGKHHEADAIVVRRDDFGEARGDVRVEAEAIEAARAHATQAARVDRDEHVQMLVFAELARDRAAACARVAFQSMRASGSPCTYARS